MATSAVVPYIQFAASFEQAHLCVANKGAKGLSAYLKMFLLNSPGEAVLWLWSMRMGTPEAFAANKAKSDSVFMCTCTI